MKTLHGGTQAPGGYYLNRKTLEICTIGTDLGTLPGTGLDRYIHIPTLAMLFLVPLMGGAFALFLPLLGFLMPARFLFSKITSMSAELMHNLAATLATSWTPGEAYLAGKPEKKSDKILESEKDDPTLDLMREIQKSREDRNNCATK